MFEKEFSVLAKFRVEDEAEESVRSALVKQFTTKVRKESFCIAFRLLFKTPDFSSLVDDQKNIRKARKLNEPGQPRANVSRRMNKRMRESELFVEERDERHRFSQPGNQPRHASIARERVF